MTTMIERSSAARFTTRLFGQRSRASDISFESASLLGVRIREKSIIVNRDRIPELDDAPVSERARVHLSIPDQASRRETEVASDRRRELASIEAATANRESRSRNRIFNRSRERYRDGVARRRRASTRYAISQAPRFRENPAGCPREDEVEGDRRGEAARLSSRYPLEIG